MRCVCRWKIGLPTWLVKKSSTGGQVVVTLAPSDVVAVALAAAGVWIWAGPVSSPIWWPLSNLMTVALLSQALELLLVGSFGTCAALLGGLMLYDAVFVFAPLLASNFPGLGTLAQSATAGNALLVRCKLFMILSHTFAMIGSGGGTESVMVAVATSDLFTLAPNKFDYPASHIHETGYPFSILGGGDIAIPGLLTSLFMRFDAAQVLDGYFPNVKQQSHSLLLTTSC